MKRRPEGASKKNGRRNRRNRVAKFLESVHLNAAGIDIGSASHWVAVPEDRDDQAVREFKSFTPDLHALADWLDVCGIETVAMESTGVYWIPLFEILQERGFEVLLVNARHVKGVPGRKTDVTDCQWLQQLHTFGLLRGSFRPDAEITAIRTLVRHRGSTASRGLHCGCPTGAANRSSRKRRCVPPGALICSWTPCVLLGCAAFLIQPAQSPAANISRRRFHAHRRVVLRIDVRWLSSVARWSGEAAIRRGPRRGSPSRRVVPASGASATDARHSSGSRSRGEMSVRRP